MNVLINIKGGKKAQRSMHDRSGAVSPRSAQRCPCAELQGWGIERERVFASVYTSEMP